MNNDQLAPTLEIRGPQPYVSIPVSVTLREWEKANALVPEVLTWLLDGGHVPASGPFYRYWTIGDLDVPFDLEIGFPVADPLSGDGRVRAGEIPAGRYLMWRHYGHPDQLDAVHTGIQQWARDNDVEPRKQGSDRIWSGRFEFYLTNPDEEPDPNKWTTEVAYLLKDKTLC